jgi:hypothetical protein
MIFICKTWVILIYSLGCNPNPRIKTSGIHVTDINLYRMAWLSSCRFHIQSQSIEWISNVDIIKVMLALLQILHLIYRLDDLLFLPLYFNVLYLLTKSCYFNCLKCSIFLLIKKKAKKMNVINLQISCKKHKNFKDKKKKTIL